MHYGAANQTANHGFVVDLVDVIKRSQIVSFYLAWRGGAFVVQGTVSQKRSTRWAEYARGYSRVPHCNGDEISVFVAGAIEQLKHRDAVDDVISLYGDLQNRRGRGGKPLVDMVQLIWNTGEVVMRNDDL